MNSIVHSEMSVGQMSVGEMSVGQMSVGEMSVGQMSVGEISVGQMSVGHLSGHEENIALFIIIICLDNIITNDNQQASLPR